MPSIVVIALPAAASTVSWQERVATPSTWTVQAPQAAIPQPYLVPVSPRVSRNAHSRGMSGGASTATSRPLIVSVVMRFSSTLPFAVRWAAL